jgi:membrane protease YdiL (CAAX protease family)
VWPDWLVLVVGLVVLPVAIAFLTPISFADLLAGDRSQWLIFMFWVAVWEWSVFSGILYWLRRSGRTLVNIGWPRLAIADAVAVGTIFVVLGTLSVLKPISADVPIDESTFLLPRSIAEKWFFLFMALTAGVCEETIFRGLGITQLKGKVGTWLAVLITTVAFVMMHGGVSQGAPAAVMRGAVALVFAGLFLWRKNLRAAIYLHFLIDASLVLIV